MTYVVVLMKSFKKYCRAIRVVAVKVSSYFVTCLLVFTSNAAMLKTISFFYLRIGRPQPNKSQSNKDYCKRYC